MSMLLLLNSFFFFFFFFFFLLNRESNLHHNIGIASSQWLTNAQLVNWGAITKEGRKEGREEGSKIRRRKKLKKFWYPLFAFSAYFYAHFSFFSFFFCFLITMKNHKVFSSFFFF